MNTLRTKIPNLLSECIEREIEIHFEFHLGDPIICWKSGSSIGHQHLDRFIKGEHAANALLIEQNLIEILRLGAP